jgi:hypothetical protein
MFCALVCFIMQTKILRNLLKMQQRQYVLFGLAIRKPSPSVAFTQCLIFSLVCCSVRHLLRHKEKPVAWWHSRGAEAYVLRRFQSVVFLLFSVKQL